MEFLKNCSNSSSFKDYKNHRFPVIADLLMNEEHYVNTLEKIFNGYVREYYNECSEIPVPEGLKEHNGCLIFANISEIYKWHKHYFLGALKENQHSIRALSRVFVENEQHFHMYAKFVFNKTISNYLISTNLSYFDNIKKKLHLKDNIDGLMIAPVFRVTHYKLFLDKLLRQLEKEGLLDDAKYLSEACNIIKAVCDQVDEFPFLNNIRNFDGLISTKGKLLLHGFLYCKYDGKGSSLYVFIFEWLVLFTEIQRPKRQLIDPMYNSRLQIPMNKLHFKELTNSKFSLQLMDPNVSNCVVICEAKTKDDYKMWTDTIKKQLAAQKNFIQDLVNPNVDDEEREILL